MLNTIEEGFRLGQARRHQPAQPGECWQSRWLASGAEGEPDWRDLVAAWKRP